MPTRRRLLALTAVLIALAGCNGERAEGIGVGAKAADFGGRDVDGNQINLGDFRGKVVLLDFWASWCGPCLAMIPHEKQLANLYKGRPFVILGVSRDHTPEDLRDFLAEVKLPWPNIYDGEGVISRRWGVDALPMLVLIDDQGVVRGRWRGVPETAELDGLIKELVRIAEQR